MTDITELKAAAGGVVRGICAALGVSDGEVSGIHFKPVNPNRADSRPGSFVIDLGGKAPGRWKEFAGDEGGDIIDLVAYLQAGPAAYKSREARGQAIAWLADHLGLQRGGAVRPDPAAQEKRRRQIEAERRAREAQDDLERTDKQKRAKSWWMRGGLPILGEDGQVTPVWRYLTEVREIPLSHFDKLPGAVRWLPARGIKPDAMISAMVRAVDVTGSPERGPSRSAAERAVKGEIVAVHLTFLRPDGRKVQGRSKIMWGDPLGASIRLSKGAVNCSPEQAAKRGKSGPLAICEGIEDGYSLAFLYPDWQVWAAGTVGNLIALARQGWPACADRVVLARDNDAAGSPADTSFDKAVGAWLNASGGRPVETLAPKGVKDFNDQWRAA